ncbi:MAG TPA: glycosyltransferase [Thermoanaerobaculia bacterium]|jgi:glycosyltransferase involved in cell wall biosynthesis/SAM-dependent methyltransferase|nr:glycosyltransferase [Thermoanaerobaculia bacterium]
MPETDLRPPPSATAAPSVVEDAAETKRRRADHFDALAADRDRWKAGSAYYHRSIEALCRRFVAPGARVLELGCGTGDLLAALHPEPEGSLGLDLSPAMIERARTKYPALRFEAGDAEALSLSGRTFDFIVASDLLGHLHDIYATLRGLGVVCHPKTRLIVTYHNFLWEGALALAERLGWKMPQPDQNWLGMQDFENLLGLGGFAVADRGTALLLPARVPLLSRAVNAVAPRVPILEHLCLVQFAVAEPAPPRPVPLEVPSVSVVIPCRNEAGNVDAAVARTPEMGRHTEILFVDGHSTDGTVERIEAAIARHRGSRDIRLIHQTPRDAGAAAGENPDRMLRLGKGDAVRKGFAAATGDIVMILDADLTVAPEDLPRFVEVLAEGRAEFVNGSRLVYPMEEESMRFLNLCGNKAFSLAFTWLLGQPVKDTLCGTKVLYRKDYERIAAQRAYFGDFDPFGDFDLLFGAARLKLAIVDMPVRYARRTTGVSKVRLVSHGMLLVRMAWIAFRKFKWNRWLGRDRVDTVGP